MLDKCIQIGNTTLTLYIFIHGVKYITTGGRFYFWTGYGELFYPVKRWKESHKSTSLLCDHVTSTDYALSKRFCKITIHLAFCPET